MEKHAIPTPKKSANFRSGRRVSSLISSQGGGYDENDMTITQSVFVGNNQKDTSRFLRFWIRTKSMN